MKGTIHNQIFISTFYHPYIYTLHHCLHLAKNLWPILYGTSHAYYLHFQTTAVQQHYWVHGPVIRPTPGFYGYSLFQSTKHMAPQASRGLIILNADCDDCCSCLHCEEVQGLAGAAANSRTSFWTSPLRVDALYAVGRQILVNWNGWDFSSWGTAVTDPRAAPK